MKRVIILLGCVLSMVKMSAEIKEIHKLSELDHVIDSAKDTDWVFLDIDYTLTEPAEPALQMAVIKQNKERFRNELAKFTEEQKQLVPVLMVTHEESQLTEPSALSLVNKLQDHKIPCFGFTAIDTSTIPVTGSIPIWRDKELKRLGINFHKRVSLVPKETVEFNEFPAYRGSYPLYENGILYSNVTVSKGRVLKAFFSRIEQMPTRIIFVDDALDNLQSVEKELENLGIPYFGFHHRPQIDPDKLPKVTEKHWKNVWAQIYERANAITP